MSDQRVRILYTNHRGVTAWRTILPQRIFFGETEWHKGEQWFLEAIDLDRRGEYRRSFALLDIRAIEAAWQPPKVEETT